MATSKPEGDCLSAEESLQFRAITFLLSKTNNVDSMGNRPTTITNTTTRSESKKTRKIYRFASHFTTLLVRHHEVIALAVLNNGYTIIPAVTCAIDSPAQAGKLEGLVASQRRDLGSFEGTSLPSVKCSVAEVKDGKFLDNGMTVAKYYIDSDITFAQHTDNIVKLLREQRFAQTKAALTTSRRKFYEYVIISSVGKIRERFYNLSKSWRNFFESITFDLPEDMQIPEPHDIPPTVPPLGKEQKLTASEVFDLLQRKCVGITYFSPEIKRAFLTRDNWYSVEGRLDFHRLLGQLLRLFRESVDSFFLEIKAHQEQAKIVKGTAGSSESPSLTALTQKVQRVFARGMHLLNLVHDFKNVLVLHLDWLAKIYALSDDVSLPRIPAFQDMGDKRFTHERSTTVLDSDESDEIFHDSAESERRIDDDDKSEITGLDELSKISWGQAAAKYLDLLLLHHRAITSLRRVSLDSESKTQKIVNTIVTQATVKTLEVVPEFRDNMRVSVDALLNTLDFDMGHPMEDEDMELVKTYLREHCNLDDNLLNSTTFLGTYHCEAVLLATQLATATKPSSYKTGYTPLPQDIISIFTGHKIQVLSMSKHCCPACYSLVQFATQGGYALEYPGSHSTWVTCSVPPWLPRDAGLHMLSVAKEVLLRRLQIMRNRSIWGDMHETAEDDICSDERFDFDIHGVDLEDDE